VIFSPRGLAIAPLGGWGNLRYSANAAFMMVLHAKYTSDSATRAACLAFAQKQTDYMLGLKGSTRWAVEGSFFLGVHHTSLNRNKAHAITMTKAGLALAAPIVQELRGRLRRQPSHPRAPPRRLLPQHARPL
jgi:hypothetical protein